MVSNKNIFCVTNPARMTDALIGVLDASGVDLSHVLIFLPSRRAVRTVERAIVARAGGACMLPRLVALGEGADEFDPDDDFDASDAVSDTEQVAALSGLLAADADIGNLSTALPIARDLVRMSSYLENEGIDISSIDWATLVDEKYAAHFQHKAAILNILSTAMPAYRGGRPTTTAVRNRTIRAWIDYIGEYELVVVCASTASVPATADLMAAVASAPNGRIILPGKISGRTSDFELPTNPYHCEYKFLRRVGVSPSDVIQIDVGPSAIDFMNVAFGNDGTDCGQYGLSNCRLIECARESEEALAVAEIASRAADAGKSVLIITPDAAANQRIATAFAARGLSADFSGGVPGAMTAAGRAILNMFDAWIEKDDGAFEKLYAACGGDLFEIIARTVDEKLYEFAPQFLLDDASSMAVFMAIKNLSDCVGRVGLKLSVADARAFVSDALSTVSVRGIMPDCAAITVLGTIESRMQTADVVILTGLNDGMFPARGYENSWLPRALAEKIGLPPADRKVSLMSLDFMNLSCGADVYWTRSRTAGGATTTESRFLSRCVVRGADINDAIASDILGAVRTRDNVPPCPLDYSAPCPPADWSDVFVTELELLIHNPYAFYVRHILRLRPIDDYWMGVDARVFGNLVHYAVSDARNFAPAALVADMDRRAVEILGADNVLFHFWHRRFLEIAPVISNELNALPGAFSEIDGAVDIAGRRVRARADLVWSAGVLDIKTGAAPSAKQLMDGNMPQLPLEAYILQSGGFSDVTAPATPVMTFLQLRANDARAIKYDAVTTAQMMRAAVDKVVALFNMYSAGTAPYEYRATTDAKYRAYDDLARIAD